MARKSKSRPKSQQKRRSFPTVPIDAPAYAVFASNQVTCSAPSSYSPNLAAPARNSFYTLMVKRSRGDWGFVHSLHGDTLVLSHHPQQMFTEASDTLRELWKASVLNQAIRYDEPVDATTLRIVKVDIDITDATNELFRSKQERDDYTKMAAVAKLSMEEARMLNVTKAKALQRLHQGVVDEAKARSIVQTTKNEGAEFVAGSLLKR